MDVYFVRTLEQLARVRIFSRRIPLKVGNIIPCFCNMNKKVAHEKKLSVSLMFLTSAIKYCKEPRTAAWNLFVFCVSNLHLMYGPKGNIYFCFLVSPEL